MSGKYNNRVLLVVFLVLAAVLVVTQFAGNKQKDRTLHTDIVRIDTSRVTTVLLYPRAEDGREVVMEKTGSGWTVSMDGDRKVADGPAIRNMLAGLAMLESEQLVARSAERWAEFQVEDSLATRIVVKEGPETTLDLLVGRFSYQQPQQNSYNPYGRNQVSGKTYVRLTGEDEVHAVEGFLAMGINQPFNRWRYQAVTRFNKALLTRIEFDFPADSGYVAERTDAGWLVAGLPADSISMTRYLNTLSRKNSQAFYDGEPPAGNPQFSLTFRGDNMEDAKVRAFALDSMEYLLNSSANPESWFRSGKEGLFGDLFVGAGMLLDREAE